MLKDVVHRKFKCNEGAKSPFSLWGSCKNIEADVAGEYCQYTSYVMRTVAKNEENEYSDSTHQARRGMLLGT